MLWTNVGNQASNDLPQKLDPNFTSNIPKLSREQAGHLRHFHNLVSQRQGEWTHMGSQVPGQEWTDAYRYQLATIVYAAAAAYYHRLPLLRSVFRDLIRRSIDKMLHRDVWGYWFLTSHSGKFVDPDLAELRKPWADPVVKENIMLIAIRYNDVRDGTDVTGQVLPKYKAAWDEKGMYQDDGFIIAWWSPNQQTKRLAPDVGPTAWAAAFMNAWNPSAARQTFATFAPTTFASPRKGEIILCDSKESQKIQEMVKQGHNPLSPETYALAKKLVDSQHWPEEQSLPYTSPLFGYAIKWVSEVGDQKTLDGLLAYADAHFSPTWEKGGLFYATEPMPPRDNAVSVSDAFTGNTAIGYARLNVFDGQRKMYERPWTPESIATGVFVDNIDFSSDVDFLRATWDDSRNFLMLTMRSWDGSTKQ
ncbi:hypothetical protein NW762_014112 [Fusarium torreyae]|uniref:Linalool dehydratase/isomerase domain-containing protein n=1 Tax=Fusarium torreyae TaxID=1237075 RepID=A0A9W8RMA3_9HYPO|nr:hypothetical protein NW762_014112 [Fusarium torreyae]